ncbi:MAG: hypothetical protein JNM64_15420 [Chloroflexia bacterium]|nr:hypothetical protein [Chloroflexia bacterium]
MHPYRQRGDQGRYFTGIEVEEPIGLPDVDDLAHLNQALMDFRELAVSPRRIPDAEYWMRP